MFFHNLGSDEDLGVTGCEGFEGLGLSEILQQALIKYREDNKTTESVNAFFAMASNNQQLRVTPQPG